MQSDYEIIGAALRYVEANARAQPSLDDIAAHVHLSPSRLQRVFREWVGISPKRFLQLTTIQHAKATLAESTSVLDATFDAGLSSPSRLHDLFVTVDAVTPGEFKDRGRSLTIRAGVHESPFGYCLVSTTERGVCGLTFHDDLACAEGYDDLAARWPEAIVLRNARATEPIHRQLFGPTSREPARGVMLAVQGTNFQAKVWQALLQVRPGQLCTYSDLARWVGQPTAARAVGNAVGRNPIAWLIPCHRVIRAMGTTGDYRWGAARKKAMIGWEMARAEEA